LGIFTAAFIRHAVVDVVDVSLCCIMWCVCVCVGASSQGKRVPAVFTPLAFGCHYFTKYAI
jgi:hypothetical protein